MPLKTRLESTRAVSGWVRPSIRLAIRLPIRLSIAITIAIGVPLPAAAQSVALAGQMGNKALLVIDGRTQMLAVGESARGVRLLLLQGDQAVVERGGAQNTLRVGGAPVRVGSDSPAAVGGAREIAIPAGPGGHFVAAGSINGRAVQFLVDTGATLVSLSQGEAERLGIDYRAGRRASTQTANGAVAVHEVTLASVRVGDIELAQVQAVVVPASMPLILLGNSFLSRLQMRRDNDVMRLQLN